MKFKHFNNQRDTIVLVHKGKIQSLEEMCNLDNNKQIF